MSDDVSVGRIYRCERCGNTLSDCLNPCCCLQLQAQEIQSLRAQLAIKDEAHFRAISALEQKLLTQAERANSAERLAHRQVEYIGEAGTRACEFREENARLTERVSQLEETIKALLTVQDAIETIKRSVNPLTEESARLREALRDIVSYAGKGTLTQSEHLMYCRAEAALARQVSPRESGSTEPKGPSPVISAHGGTSDAIAGEVIAHPESERAHDYEADPSGISMTCKKCGFCITPVSKVQPPCKQAESVHLHDRRDLGPGRRAVCVICGDGDRVHSEPGSGK